MIEETLYPALRQRITREASTASPYTDLTGGEDLAHAVFLDQSPLARSPRSNPVTYLKAFDEIRAKYEEYGVKDEPFVIVNADAGTYGMGVMTVRDAKELDEVNRRTRNKMDVVKDGQQVTEVIIQEGVPTYERVNEAVADSVDVLIKSWLPIGGDGR